MAVQQTDTNRKKWTLYFCEVLILFIFFIFFQASLQAQKKSILSIAEQCSQPELKKNLFRLASEEMEGRLMGSHGDTLTSLFIADAFQKAGLISPYQNSYFQAIKVKRQVTEGSLSFSGKQYQYANDWTLYPVKPFAFENSEVIFIPDTTIESVSNYILSNEVSNKAVLVPETVILKTISTNTIDSLETLWKSKGLVSIMWSGKSIERSLTNMKLLNRGQYMNELLNSVSNKGSGNLQVIYEIGLNKTVLNDLVSTDNILVKEDGSYTNASQAPQVLKNKIGVSVRTRYTEVTAPNVIGVMLGQDPTLPVVVLSAHHDHEGKRGNEIFYGAVDNASGTVAIMEIARLMQLAIRQGLRPKRSIVFASFTGEERNLLGSTYYVNNPLYPMSKTYGIMNLDMMGRVDTFYSGKRPDSSYAYILVKDSLHYFRKSLMDANAVLGELTLDTRYEDPRYIRRRLEGSDQFPFYLKKIPFIRIDCGFSADYHKVTDTPDKINYELLTKQTKLAFLTLWNMANE